MTANRRQTRQLKRIADRLEGLDNDSIFVGDADLSDADAAVGIAMTDADMVRITIALRMSTARSQGTAR